MKVHKIISKSKSGKRMEIVAIDSKGQYHTCHIHRSQAGWHYCAGFNKKGEIILKIIDMGGKR